MMDQDVALARRLNDFLPQVARLLIGLRSTCEAEPVLTPVSLQAFCQDAHEPLRRLQDAACANVWATASLGTDEVKVCSVLAKLWDWHFYGDEGRSFLTRCFAMLGESALPDEIELRDGYQVQTELCPLGDVSDRVDITVETSRSIIGIEVKIHAGEGERQLQRYLSSIGMRAAHSKRENAQVIFLSARRFVEADAPVHWLTWEKVSDAAALANTTTTSGLLISEFGKFCRGLGS